MEDDFPRLCGGTFFTLLLKALKKRRNKRDVYRHGGDGLSNSEVFMGLIQIVDSDYVAPETKETLRNQASNFRKCKVSSGGNLPFKDNATLQIFDDRIKNEYGDVLQKMVDFSSNFLSTETGMHKDIRLVKALLDLISQDQTISDDEIFYIERTGQGVSKKKMIQQSSFCYESFLLGVWHYTVMNRQDNTVGQETFRSWCPQAGERKELEYKGHMGESFHDVTLTYAGKIAEDEGYEDGGEQTAAESEDGTEEEAATKSEEKETVKGLASVTNIQTQNNNTVQILGNIGQMITGTFNGDVNITNNLDDDDDE